MSEEVVLAFSKASCGYIEAINMKGGRLLVFVLQRLCDGPKMEGAAWPLGKLGGWSNVDRRGEERGNMIRVEVVR